MTLVSQNVKTRASHALYSPATFVAISISLLTFGFLGLTLSPDLTPPDTYAESQSSKMRVSIAPAASIALEYYDPDSSSYISSNNLNISIDPGSFKTGAIRVTTSTNSPAGMKLSMNDSDTNTSLIEQNDNQVSPTQQAISSITANTTINDATDSTNAFNDNTWGYAIADTTAGSTSAPTVPLTYSQIPTTETLLKETATLGDSAYIFTAGVRVGRTLPAGTYKDQLTFTVVANPLPETRTIFDIDTMQDMNSDICKNTPTPTTTSDLATALTDITVDSNTKLGNKVPSVTMKDSRDNQTYVIRKLADGHCWMTESLRYGAAVDTQTTPSTTPEKRPYVSSDAALSASGFNATKMADLTAGRIITGISGQTGVDDNSAFSDNAEYFTEPYIAINAANTTDEVSGTGMRYGVLYNYCAATGGTACTASGTTPTVSSSICPTNWTLPDFDAQVGTTVGTNASYNNLTAAYHITVNTETGVNIILGSPLSFPRSGSFVDGTLWNRSASGYGSYWSSRPYGGVNAYSLVFGGTADIGQGNYTRREASALRGRLIGPSVSSRFPGSFPVFS